TAPARLASAARCLPCRGRPLRSLPGGSGELQFTCVKYHQERCRLLHRGPDGEDWVSGYKENACLLSGFIKLAGKIGAFKGPGIATLPNVVIARWIDFQIVLARES